MDYEFILFDKQDGIATITMNRPDKLNALHIPIGVEMMDALDRCEQDDEVRAIVLTGAGRAFCAGDDVKRDTSGERVYLVPSKRYVYAEHRWTTIVREMARLPKPTIAMINGHAHGAGFNLALGCDFRVMSDAATLAVPFVRWGMATGTNRLQQFVGIGKALEWGLLGKRISPEEAERWGLVTSVVPHDELQAATNALASELAQGPTAIYGYTKHAIYSGWELDPDPAYELQGMAQHFARQTHDYAEGRTAFKEKRTPRYTGK